ncbi:MAG: hypothetical protein RR879_05240 [Hydrogenoanaerobacterium sp.]
MKYKHCCVIDENNDFKAFVQVLIKPNGEEIQSYIMKNSERLIDAAPPLNIVKAKWNGTAWEEMATPEEIAAYADSRQRLQNKHTRSIAS